MSETDKTLHCTCDDLTELERYYDQHWDNCPLSDYQEFIRSNGIQSENLTGSAGEI